MNAKETPTAPQPGLRERKKQRTLQTIRREAYRLFAAHGYEATTVDQIADAAEVSPSTFFRYFPTKEDVVLRDEYDPALVAALRSRPPGEPIIDSIRHALTDSLGQMLEADHDELLLRTRLGFTDPAIRARSWDELQRSQDVVAAVISERTGRDPDDLDVHCAAAALMAVSTAVVRHWVQRDGEVDLVALYDRQFALLAQGIRF
ncbi:TetR family transcriptional regulator [Streptomyces cocklensis]|uniref:Transcriptional regulator, TetR family n=1 Tax=Actinacidiphila cocklensis TaxID=887465 RepID=A0A9W4E9S7_9ACTN|nr:TetR family transcriptional regulator [Actinacidiphila cocklensis]MDD1063790.1 TetR family transcriptional regulator [Actinacidiphila cocklensis]WSX73047.1 TetR family transcriptional regulator [Streptomyces sp. NBC_00899]WSX80887.1 TetR family transcriptional regulator [Streptomyces sp. NBC_00899]CAG6396616.1 Transcriptional regulator, TetR family [Actinacidiphila cocklensis]